MAPVVAGKSAEVATRINEKLLADEDAILKNMCDETRDKQLNATASASVATGPVDEAKKEKDSKYEMMLRLGAEGKLNAHSSAVTAFNRDKNGGQSKEYKNLDGHAKKEFKRKYFETHLEKFDIEKTKTTSITKKFRPRGSYSSLYELAVAQGTVKAVAYAKKCASMGDEWIEWDAMWEHYTYFVVRREWEESFKEAWSLHLKHSGTAGAEPPAKAPRIADAGPQLAAVKDDPPEEPEAEQQEPEQPTPTPKAQAKSESKASAKKDAKPKQSPKPAKTLSLVDKAAKTKSKYVSTTSSASNVLLAIKNNGDWSYWDNDEQLQGLTNAKDQLDAAVAKHSFFQDYLTLKKTTDVSKKYKESYEASCGTMVEKLDPLVAELARQTSAVVAMKLARENVMNVSACDRAC